MALPTFDYTTLSKVITINDVTLTFRPLIIKDFERIFDMQIKDDNLSTVKEMALLLADLLIDSSVTLEEKQEFFKSVPVEMLNNFYKQIGGQTTSTENT